MQHDLLENKGFNSNASLELFAPISDSSVMKTLKLIGATVREAREN